MRTILLLATLALVSATAAPSHAETVEVPEMPTTAAQKAQSKCSTIQCVTVSASVDRAKCYGWWYWRYCDWSLGGGAGGTVFSTAFTAYGKGHNTWIGSLSWTVPGGEQTWTGNVVVRTFHEDDSCQASTTEGVQTAYFAGRVRDTVGHTVTVTQCYALPLLGDVSA